MTITLEPELETALNQKAAAEGQNPDEYLRRLIHSALHQNPPTILRSALTNEEFLKSSQETVERAKARNLAVSTSDFRREDIYNDEEGR